MKHAHLLAAGLVIIAIIAGALSTPPGRAALVAPPAGEPQLSNDMSRASAANGPGKDLWQPATITQRSARTGSKPAIQPLRLSSYTLNRGGMAALLGTAPRERTQAARANPLVLSLPNPRGEFQSFTVQEAAVMAPGLAAKHPEIKTYSGRGIDDPAATLRFDLTPLGFHASVRSPGGAWYIDPYYHLDQSLYASYYGRDLPPDQDEVFVERDAEATETAVLHGGAFASDAAITIADPEQYFAERTLSVQSDALGLFEASYAAAPDGNLAADLPTGDVLRTYRLALITDPGYAAFFGGSENVTAAKVTLINRVSQIYEDDLSIRLELVEDNDLLNLDTWDQAIAPNGPCGAAGCFTQAQVTGCTSTTRARFVIGQIIGASNYDIGHLALGQPGGGIANLGVVGRSNKAGGWTRPACCTIMRGCTTWCWGGLSARIQLCLGRATRLGRPIHRTSIAIRMLRIIR
jgi:trimeric autotransporter adhesin